MTFKDIPNVGEVFPELIVLRRKTLHTEPDKTFPKDAPYRWYNTNNRNGTNVVAATRDPDSEDSAASLLLVHHHTNPQACVFGEDTVVAEYELVTLNDLGMEAPAPELGENQWVNIQGPHIEGWSYTGRYGRLKDGIDYVLSDSGCDAVPAKNPNYGWELEKTPPGQNDIFNFMVNWTEFLGEERAKRFKPAIEGIGRADGSYNGYFLNNGKNVMHTSSYSLNYGYRLKLVKVPNEE